MVIEITTREKEGKNFCFLEKGTIAADMFLKEFLKCKCLNHTPQQHFSSTQLIQFLNIMGSSLYSVRL